MLFQQLNRTDAEKVFGIFQNAETNAAPINSAVCLDLSTAVNGVRVKKPATAELNGFVGLVHKEIPAGAYGLVQIYGYRATGSVLRTNSDITAGNMFAPVDGQFGVYVNTDGKHIMVCESLTSGTGTTALKVHIRAM